MVNPLHTYNQQIIHSDPAKLPKLSSAIGLDFRRFVMQPGRYTDRWTSNLSSRVAGRMEHKRQASDIELTPDDRRSQVASLIATAILRMRPPTDPVCGNLSQDFNAGLDLISESLLTVTRGDCSTRDN